jgi:predicted nucleic acid-binding protein
MTEWLIDKSALVRLPASPDVEAWLARVDRGLVRIAMPTLLEQGYSARTYAGWREATGGEAMSLLPLADMTPWAERRALEVQGKLAKLGQHRAPSVADLLIAAIAEGSNLTVLHLDKDFDLIAGVTGQRVERLALGRDTEGDLG